MLDPVTIRTVAPLVAALFLAFTYYRARRVQRGPSADFWEQVRRRWLPPLDRLARRLDVGYAAYQLGEDEYVGHLVIGPERTEELLYQHGFRRNPLAAFKTLEDGREECGSWVSRESLFSRRQVHVIVFPAAGGLETQVFAHAEYSSINPLVALKHYRGEDYSPLQGQAVVRRRIPDGAWLASA